MEKLQSEKILPLSSLIRFFSLNRRAFLNENDNAQAIKNYTNTFKYKIGVLKIFFTYIDI